MNQLKMSVMKKLLFLSLCACSMICYAQENTSTEDAFYTSSQPEHIILICCGAVSSGDKVNRTFTKFNAKQPANEPDTKLYTIVSYDLQFNGVYFKVRGAELTEEIRRAISLAPKKTKLTGLFYVKDEVGVMRKVAGTWELK
jgi:hypothetical protein